MNPLYLAQSGGTLLEENRSASPSGDFWPLFWGLIGFAALLALSYFALRFLSRRNLMGARGSHMRVLDRMAMGKDSMILIIELAGRILAVGVTREGFSTLCELDPEEWAEGESASRGPRAARRKGDVPKNTGFWKRFVHNMGVNSGVLPKGTPPARPDGKEGAPLTFGEYLAKTQAETQIHGDTHPVSGQIASEGPGNSSIQGPGRPAAPLPASGGFAYRNEAPLQQTYMNPTPYDAVLQDARLHYTAALASVKKFSNMEKPAAPVSAARPAPWGEAAPASGHSAAAPAAEREAAPPPASGPAQVAVEQQMEELADRVSRRADRLARKAKTRGGKKAD